MQLIFAIIILLISIQLNFANNNNNFDDDESKHLTAPIGQLFRLNIGEDVELDNKQLPKWLQQFEGGIIEGIPQLKDLGTYLIYSIEDALKYQIEVYEELENFCREGPTSWIEIISDKNISQVPIKQQIETIRTMLSTIKNELKEFDYPEISEFRLYEFKYLKRHRIILKTILEGDFGDQFVLDNLMVLILNLSCGELSDFANEYINMIADTNPLFQVIEGVINPDREPISTTILTTTTLSATTTPTTTNVVHYRTTRQVYDNKPIVVNKISTMKCKKGILCRLKVGENTFNDAEEGSTSRLKLSVQSMDGNIPFLMAIPRSTILEGVPLKTGAHTMRLEARDRLNQMVSTSFQVIVDEYGNMAPNHQFSMLIDKPMDRLIKNSSNIRDFVYKLNSALENNNNNRIVEPNGGVFKIRINAIDENGPTQTMIRWSNVTLISSKKCDLDRIKHIQSQMVMKMNFGGSSINSPQREKVKIAFERIMGPEFHVRKVNMDLFSSCLAPINLINIRVTTTTSNSKNLNDEEAAEPTSTLFFGQSLLIPIILLAVLLIFLILLLLLYCVQRKGSQKKKFVKGKKMHADYLSKGLPAVIFPEEVPHGEDDDDSGLGHGVTTPMLITNEQPSAAAAYNDHMTLHENPLYKPPPMAQATLLSTTTNNYSSSNPNQIVVPSTTSTFATPPSTTHRNNNTSSPPLPRAPPSATIVGQRLPPPYVAAI